MPRPFVTIPPALLRVTSVTWKIDWRNQNAGTLLNGRPGRGGARFARWVGSPELVLHGNALPRYRALVASAEGELGILRVVMFDPLGGHRALAQALPFLGGALFDDGTGFENLPVAPCVGGAAAGATEIVIDETDAPAPVQVGQIISHSGPAPDGETPMSGDFPAIVTWREQLSGNLARLGVSMPLRIAIPDGDPVQLIGSGYFHLRDPMMAWPDYGLDRVARPRLDLVEWLR